MFFFFFLNTPLPLRESEAAPCNLIDAFAANVWLLGVIGTNRDHSSFMSIQVLFYLQVSIDAILQNTLGLEFQNRK